MKLLLHIFIIITLFFWGYSCKPKDEVINTDSSIKLRFSTDTVQFDTLLTTIGSVSKQIRVYNDDQNAVNISTIFVGNTNSPYEIIINGKPSNAKDIRLLGGDSLRIIVKVTLDPNSQNLPYVIRDNIFFETNGNTQSIQLEAWGRDAHFINNGNLACATTWKNDKAYVISDSVIVPENCELIIEEGCHILFKYNAQLIVKGSLKVLGTKDSLVRFFNDNDLGVVKKAALGYWKGIKFTETSKNSILKFTHIENAFNGISGKAVMLDSITDITLQNVQILNMLQDGIQSEGYNIVAENTLVSNCVSHLLNVENGGNYHFNHCTFAHLGSGVKNEALQVKDGKLTLINSIIWGTQQEELTIDGGTNYFINNIIKTAQNFDNNILNEDPLFKNRILLDYSLDSLSPAIDKSINSTLLIDLQGNNRDNSPDIGAFEFIPNN